ncbi:hypothetical protein BDZ91DRAFT_561406 [Kalaharituber pfeilii]|nr:hypothetical protein BDZ91DRAFT_561406 [Kalaharituber pfeilii]
MQEVVPCTRPDLRDICDIRMEPSHFSILFPPPLSLVCQMPAKANLLPNFVINYPLIPNTFLIILILPNKTNCTTLQRNYISSP